MEPYEAINSLEASLRVLILDVLGDSWIEQSGIDIEVLEGRKTEEAARRKGAAIEQNLLSYTHIYELRKIIGKNWEKFKPALTEKKQFDVYMDRIEDFRNAPMHSRELLPFERDLLAGIVGEIRNLTTIFRSQQGPDRKHYPVVESIVDSFGTEFRPRSSNANDLIGTGIRLQVGDCVEFACRAWDSQDRKITWSLGKLSGVRGIDKAIGNTARLTWVVTEDDVGEDCKMQIIMYSDGKYHRGNNYDFSLFIQYAVDPPL